MNRIYLGSYDLGQEIMIIEFCQLFYMLAKNYVLRYVIAIVNVLIPIRPYIQGWTLNVTPAALTLSIDPSIKVW